MPSGLDVLEWVAVASTLLNVWLVMRADIRAFIPGVVSALTYGAFFHLVDYQANAGLSFFYYLPMQVYGYWIWKTRGPNHNDDLPLRAGTIPTHVASLGAGALAAIPAYALVRAVNGSANWLDALTTGISIIAQILLSHKRAENWFLWAIANAAYVVLFVQSGTWASAALYFILLVMAVKGWRDWVMGARRGEARVA